MSQALGPLSIGLQAATTMYDAVGQRDQLRAAAATDTENARLTELDGALQSEDIRRRGRAVQGEAIAALSEGGGSVGSGSARDLIFQNALEIEYAVLGARYSAASEARGLRMSAAQKKQAARSAMIGGLMGAGAAALTGAANARNQSAVDAARSRREQAYFPGAQQLPLPPSYNRAGGH